MTNGDASDERHQPRPDHDLWLAMQATHAQWMEASRILDEFTASVSCEVPSPGESLRLARASEQQRIAFQEYVEARLAFAEFLLSHGPGAAPQPAPTPQSSWRVGPLSTLAVLLLAIALLSPAAFCLAYLLQVKKQAREVETAREAVNAMLVQVRTLASTPVSTPATIPAPVVSKAKQPVSAKPAPPPGTRNFYTFALAPSARYAPVGPFRVSLYNVDRAHRSFDLSLRLGDFTFERRRIRLNEPIWINLGGGYPSVRVVADRISATAVHGSIVRLSRPDMPSAPNTAVSSNRGKILAESPPGVNQRLSHGGY
jgi:hypothetical protein